MPPKRKITLTLGASKKKQKTADAPTVASEEPVPDYYSSLTDFYTHVINSAIDFKDEETGDVISGPFLKLPPKKVYADYYQIIKNPISINEIRQATIVKRRNKELIANATEVTLDDFKQMWQTMAKNAATYNDPESLIVKDANAISNYAIAECDNYKVYLEKQRELNDANKQENLKKEETPSNRRTKADRKRSRSKVSSTAIVEPDEEFSSTDAQNDEQSTTVEPVNTEKKDKKAEQEYDEEQPVQREEKMNTVVTKAELAKFDDSNIDYTPELYKLLRHLLTFKISHHKNSIPLSKVFMELPDREDPNTEDYYDIITEPMCFNMISKKLDDGEYSNGSEGRTNFLADVNLIFDNAMDVFGDGPFHKAATGLAKALSKRMEKFESQIKERKKLAILNIRYPGYDGKSKKKTTTVKDTTTNKSIPDDAQGDDVNAAENQDEDVVLDAEELSKEVAVEVPTIIRKHDVEKAETIEEIDDITAFIKRFSICTTTNLTNLANNWKSLTAASSGHSKQNNNNNNNNNNTNNANQSVEVFENIIVEPAGNTTFGGSTYIMQLPGSSIIGHEISCIVHLQNKIVDEKYVSELKVNGETINGLPMSITYDEDAGDNGMFCAGKYAVRLGYGLNHFEFTLKVPFPLKKKSSDSEEIEHTEGRVTRNGASVSQISETDEDDLEKKERHERGKAQEFTENVKIWLNITR